MRIRCTLLPLPLTWLLDGRLILWRYLLCGYRDEEEAMVGLLGAIGDALRTAFDMLWEVLWPLILGFSLSGVVQAVVSHRAMARLLGDDSPKSLSLATLFGVASSSCSYAA